MISQQHLKEFAAINLSQEKMHKQTNLKNQLDTMRKKKSIHNMYRSHRINYLQLVLIVSAFTTLFTEGKSFRIFSVLF